MKQNLRIAAFGFRHIPYKEGSAGSDKFALELYSRLAQKGILVTAYNRVYDHEEVKIINSLDSIKLINIRTVKKSGFDSLLHSFKATFHIIFNNTADIVHIHNGGNSIFALPLRLFRKKVIVSQDGIDWKRNKWKWYGKIYLLFSSILTAYLPNKVIFDNIFSKELFESKFKRKFNFIPYGSEINIEQKDESILNRLKLEKGEYFLFVGRFIPDKGLQYLIPAFERIKTEKKLVLVGGSPNPSLFEKQIMSTKDKRIQFAGYIYGNDTNILMKNAYAYIQPSDIEGLSPVILTIMGLGIPLICSDIRENVFLVNDNAVIFKKSSTKDLEDKINFALNNFEIINQLASKAKVRALRDFSWETVTNQYIKIFSE